MTETAPEREPEEVAKAAEAQRTVAESILDRYKREERTVPFGGFTLRLATPSAKQVIDLKARVGVLSAELIANAVRPKIESEKQGRKPDPLAALDHAQILDTVAQHENMLVIKACADAADPLQLTIQDPADESQRIPLDDETMLRVVVAEGPFSEAIEAARALSLIHNIKGPVDPFGLPARRAKRSKRSKRGRRRR